jgi:hypothetical protein
VSFDTEEENRAFAEKYNFPFRLLCDTKREIGMAYGACDSPTADYARRITYVIGPDGRILQAIGTVNARASRDAGPLALARLARRGRQILIEQQRRGCHAMCYPRLMPASLWQRARYGPAFGKPLFQKRT